MCHTLKEAAQSEAFKRAMEWLIKDQKVRLNNGYYTQDNYGQDQ